jgi:YjbE family integral membrane protein
MDIDPFLSALMAIVVIDIVLAGDNAIVIALAARALPAHLQRRAVMWGAIGAIGVRSLLTVAVVWLLKIPGLLLVGGAALVWIAYRLLRPGQSGHGSDKPAVAGFWGALRTIIAADAVMGLDNVLAVAGAAHGRYVLVITGLAISVPIVIWGSTMVLKLVDRFPAVVYVGAAVLVWTAAKMISADPLLRPWFDAAPALAWLVFVAVPLVLWVGFSRNHRQLESRMHTRLQAFASQCPTGASASPVPLPSTPAEPKGDPAMLKVLVPIDGSANALQAVRHAIAEYRRHHELELHLLNVQPRLYHHIARFVSRHDREAWQHDRADAAMAGARALLAEAGVPHQTHWATGEHATEICQAARRLGVHHIVMGVARKDSITRMLEDSVTGGVLEATPVPVEVVAGSAVSPWERWGMAVGAAIGACGLLWVAID